MLDSDLAELYFVETKRLNEQVGRNPDRFPEDFKFQLTDEEWLNWALKHKGCQSLKKQKSFTVKPGWNHPKSQRFCFTKKHQLDGHIVSLFAIKIILYQNFSLQLFDNKSILSIFAVPNLMGIINCLIN